MSACVRVAIGEEHYALAVESVLEVGTLHGVTAVPGSAPSLLGVVNREGQVLPVVDLAPVIGVTSAGPPACLLVVEDGQRRACLAVDEVLDVRATPEFTEATGSDMLSGAALVDGNLVGMLEIASVLDEAARRNGDGYGR